MGVELISLSCDNGVVEKGVLKLTEFSSEVSFTKDKKELEALVMRAKTLRFTVEDWRDETKTLNTITLDQKSDDSLGKEIQDTIDKIDDVAKESVEAVYKMIEESLDSSKLY